MSADAEPSLIPAGPKSGPFLDDFWSHVEVTDGCWWWRGRFSSGGYGLFEGVLAHRLVIEALGGELIKGLTVDHLCRNRACVRIEHLEQVTRSENSLRIVRSPRPRRPMRNGCPGCELLGFDCFDHRADAVSA